MRILEPSGDELGIKDIEKKVDIVVVNANVAHLRA